MDKEQWKRLKTLASSSIVGGDIKAALSEIERLNRLLFGARCVYCGQTVGENLQNQDLSDELLREHVKTCSHHPFVQMKQRAEAAEALLRWTACAESLPDSDTTVMTFAPDSSEPVWPGYHDGEEWVDMLGAPMNDAIVTHWMQFPEAPAPPSSLARALEGTVEGGTK